MMSCAAAAVEGLRGWAGIVLGSWPGEGSGPALAVFWWVRPPLRRAAVHRPPGGMCLFCQGSRSAPCPQWQPVIGRCCTPVFTGLPCRSMEAQASRICDVWGPVTLCALQDASIPDPLTPCRRENPCAPHAHMCVCVCVFVCVCHNDELLHLTRIVLRPSCCLFCCVDHMCVCVCVWVPPPRSCLCAFGPDQAIAW